MVIEYPVDTDEGKFAYNTGIVEINLKGEEDLQ